ncbi:isochorismate synthase MenF [uncultured Friedmanniella sp.]|uniref:isochorismate synthase n=1 Tax=uncultured Friedmanniella sp. TaxID=335381 RepID=UPI0035CC653D
MTSTDPAPPSLRVRTVEIDDPGALPALLPGDGGFAWVRHGEGVVGWGEAVRHKPTGIADAEEWWAELAGSVVVEAELADPPAGAGLLAFGSFVFDPDSAGRSTLVVPAVVVGRRAGRAWLTRIGTAFGEPPSLEPAAAPRPPSDLTYAGGALSVERWQQAVSEAVARIGAGRLDKVVLARDLMATSSTDLDLRWVLGRLSERYPSCWSYLVDGLVGATPEMLVRVEAGRVASRVLAGTVRRSVAPSPATQGRADGRLGAALAGSSKDLEEHGYAVASVAGSLRPFCSALEVPEEPYVLELPNVLHLATDITGLVRPGSSSLSLAAALHPSAAVCGTPTAAARTLIAELEHLDRERYAGPVGWIDARGDGEWGIALRCGQLDETDPRRIRIFAGCGIVAGSDPEAELAESVAKLMPMREALALDGQTLGGQTLDGQTLDGPSAVGD